MQKESLNKIFSIIGIILIILGIIAIIITINNKTIDHILWICYFFLIISGIGLLYRNSFIIASQLNLIIIPFLVWNIDFLSNLILSQSLWGITDYFFASRPPISQIITAQHIFTIPILIYTLYKIKLKRKDSWKISIAEGITLFIIVRFFTNPESNINCAFKSCIPNLDSVLHFIPYSISWIIIFCASIFLTNYILNLLFYKKSK